MGAVVDDTGKLLKLGLGSLIYFAVVVGTAAFSLRGGLVRHSCRLTQSESRGAGASGRKRRFVRRAV
jgi:hypothetical protein